MRERPVRLLLGLKRDHHAIQTLLAEIVVDEGAIPALSQNLVNLLTTQLFLRLSLGRVPVQLCAEELRILICLLMDLLMQAQSRVSPFNLKEGCAKRIQESGYVTFAVHIHVFHWLSKWWVERFQVNEMWVCMCFCRNSNAGEGFFEAKKGQPKDSTRKPTSKSSPFAAPNSAPKLMISETHQAQALDDNHTVLWQGGRWSVTLQQRPHTSTGMQSDHGGLWQVRVRM